ncbi:MAG TPA: Pvc16 family protein [Candidatus Kapabacteria bacterium]|nr:Pvc16 family protein [Candidatus Kapabacteria bacterium]
MALADSGKAIGAVSSLIVERLASVTGLHVQVSRPDAATSPMGSNPRLNVFLYETQFDPGLKNEPLDDGQPPPLWMVARYMLTAYDGDGESDTAKAHEVLGEACRALQENSFLQLRPTDPAGIIKALIDNPHDLKITFVDAAADLLSKVMQGTDERYRLSIAFEVRPIMIAVGTPPSYSLLVGIDYTQAPPNVIGLAGVHNIVIPSLGSSITEIVPASFEVGDTITINGTDLDMAGLSVRLGAVDLPVTAQNPGWLKCVIRPDLVNGSTISAGTHPVTVVHTLPSGREQRSNVLLGELVPQLAAVNIISKTINPPPPIETAEGTIELNGLLLGTENDETYVALYRDGHTVQMYDTLADSPGPPPPQTSRRFTIPHAGAVPSGSYIVLVRVNGAQARNGLTVNLVT